MQEKKQRVIFATYYNLALTKVTRQHFPKQISVFKIKK